MDYSDWVGNSVTSDDLITPRMVDHFKQTLGEHCFKLNDVPPGMHWCLAPGAVSPDALGQDGHPKLGSFLPKIPYARRMWAGGWLEFYDEFKIGDQVKRHSRIDDIIFKTGKSGNLCFVAITHEFSVGDQLKLRERHDVVYREEVTVAPPLDWITESKAAHRWQVDANSVMLFRYSALTFNGHRIHYDFPYSTNVEGHSGLLVHGPLQATLILNLACSIGRKLPKHMTYRGVRPLVCGDPIMVDASPENNDAGKATLAACVRGADGNVTMEASVNF